MKTKYFKTNSTPTGKRISNQKYTAHRRVQRTNVVFLQVDVIVMVTNYCDRSVEIDVDSGRNINHDCDIAVRSKRTRKGCRRVCTTPCENLTRGPPEGKKNDVAAWKRSDGTSAITRYCRRRNNRPVRRDVIIIHTTWMRRDNRLYTKYAIIGRVRWSRGGR